VARGVTERPRRTARWDVHDDTGGAILEFIGITVLMLVPLLYLIVTLARIQSGLFAAEASAHDAARAVVVTGVAALEEGATQEEAFTRGQARAAAVTEVTLGDFGFTPDAVTLTWACTTTPCLSPGGNVAADVTLTIPLPGVPGLLGGAVPLEVTVASAARAPVDGLAGDT